MSDLHLNVESDYSEENTCDNEVFRSTIFQPFQLDLEQKKTCGSETYKKETVYIHALAANLLNIRIANFDWVQIKTLKKRSEINRLPLM